MANRHFMLDIETTGIDPAQEDLLQVGVLEVTFDDESGLWVPGRSLTLHQHTSRKPESEFAKTHMAELYALCGEVSPWPAEKMRKRLLTFFQSCGAHTVADTFLMGWNASNFDVPFLVSKGVLVPSSYVTGPDGKDTMVGDFHYRIYELGGAVALASDVLKVRKDARKTLTENAAALADDIPLPAGKEHDALYDCYKQLRILNGLIKMTRKGSR